MPALSADGSTLAFVARDGNVNALVVGTFSGQTPLTVVKRTSQPLIAPVLSPDGRRVAYAVMPREDFEVMVSDADGRNERRLTSDIQHDYPTAFLTPDLLLTRKGESRHTRSYLFDAGTGAGQRLFHNNTVRTVSMEYGWAPSPDGKRLLVIADRDGDPYTPERGVWLMDLTRTVSTADLLARVRRMLADERALAARAARLYLPIAPAVRAATTAVAEARVRRHVENLSQFGSRQIRLPGNRRAIDYIAGELRAMGYTPDVQEFEPEPGVPSANVSVTIRGTANPDLVYVVSSHLDSVEESPGADDNGAGTCALLEVARVMKDRPQAATVVLLWVTGEEEGLLGSHEWVRRAKAAGVRVMADLNNDTFAWTREARTEATVRYSNPAFLDIEHGAALEFTSLVTHDARMFQSSDGGAFFEGYGDIVGGFGSYPILASPHYHQSSDAAETVSPRTIAEVAKATVASLMLLSSSPSPLHDLRATKTASGATVTWTAAPERGVTGYRVTYGAGGSATRRTLIVRTPRAVLPGVAAGTEVAVRAMTARGLEGWGWARTTIKGEE
jgi:peptidase M28-like protein/WD40 repeat protein